jgi:hypothetical protein
MSNIVSKSWTHNVVAGAITITSDFNLTIISILSSVGDTTITGSRSANGLPAAPIILLEGQSVTISSGADSTIPIDGIVINAAGTAILIGR